MVEKTKICTKCKKVKLLSEFRKQSYRRQCKKCLSDNTKIYYEKNKEKILEKSRKYKKLKLKR